MALYKYDQNLSTLVFFLLQKLKGNKQEREIAIHLAFLKEIFSKPDEEVNERVQLKFLI